MNASLLMLRNGNCYRQSVHLDKAFVVAGIPRKVRAQLRLTRQSRATGELGESSRLSSRDWGERTTDRTVSTH